MFQGKRLITRGVADTISSEVQMFLWALLDELVAKMAEEPDYLQVFEFSGDNGNQTIIHRQENPPYQAIYQLWLVLHRDYFPAGFHIPLLALLTPVADK